MVRWGGLVEGARTERPPEIPKQPLFGRTKDSGWNGFAEVRKE